MSKKAARAKAAWMAMLAKHRRPWPEWAELERRVCDRDFVTQSTGHSIVPVPHVFLFSGAVGEEPPLTRRIASRGALVPDVAAPFPGWVAPLVGLGCLHAGDLDLAGALASDLWPPNRLRPIVTADDWDRVWSSRTLKESLPCTLFQLQSNQSGTPLFSDGRSVLGWAEETETLDAVGDLEVFLRFCCVTPCGGRTGSWPGGEAMATRKGFGA